MTPHPHPHPRIFSFLFLLLHFFFFFFFLFLLMIDFIYIYIYRYICGTSRIGLTDCAKCFIADKIVTFEKTSQRFYIVYMIDYHGDTKAQCVYHGDTRALSVISAYPASQWFFLQGSVDLSGNVYLKLPLPSLWRSAYVRGDGELTPN